MTTPQTLARAAARQSPGAWHRLRPYLVGAFGITWTLWAVAILSPQSSHEFPTMLIAILGGFGPLVTAVYLLRTRSTAAERHAVWRSVVDWRRVALGWWPALLVVGVVPAVVARLLPLGDAAAQAVGADALVYGLVGGVIPAIAEELGWRGYALDRTPGRSVVAAGLTLGVIWTVWHLPLFWLEGWTHQVWGVQWLPVFAAFVLAQSVIMTIAYYANGRSVLTAVVLHLFVNLGLDTLRLTASEFAAMTAGLVVCAVVAVMWQARVGLQRS